MVTTLLARRDAKEATTQSRKLAVETERLVSATTAAQALAVRPVLECRRPGESRRLSIRNCGHGPVVDPQALTPAGGLTRLQAREGRERNALAEEYVEVGSLGVGEEAFVALGPKAPDAVVITIQGASLAGQHLSWTLDEREFESRAVVVATEIGEVAA
jgi:hypothetical protein